MGVQTMLMEVIKKHIASIPPYVPGKPVAELEREMGVRGAIKMASNENPLGPSPSAMESIRDLLSTCHIYPESSAPVLREAIASVFDLSAENVILGNGSDEIMQLCAHILIGPGDQAIMPTNSFSMYRIVVESFGGEPIKVPLGKDYGLDLSKTRELITDRTRIIFLANPNSPTGTIVTSHALKSFLADLPSQKILVILDEAYREFVREPSCPEGSQLIMGNVPLIVLRTFSKIYGLAGLRIGYGLAQPWLIEILNRVRAPFNANSLAQAGALAALTDTDHLRRSRELVWSGLDYLSVELTSLGFHVIPSQANFLCFCIGSRARDVYEYLLRKGIIVRHLASFGMEDWIRVTVGKTEHNEAFIKALSGFVRDHGELR
ncbi:MAG: histidinol-phosphate aminotransferase [Thermodesulfobacteriota bacterium]|nr:histidinol-phosphate aminotransferase [Thermodesulfobacteriota bacterium]